MAKNEGFFEEPNMSDATLLVTVEDLINRAMGPTDGNIVNFKLIQTILHILARQQRMLEQRVEIRVIEIKKHRTKKKHTDESSDSSSETSSPMFKPQKSPRSDAKRDRSDAAFKSKGDKKGREAEKEDTLEKRKKSERTQRDESAPFKTKQTQLMVADEEDEDGIEKEDTKAQAARNKVIKVSEIGKEEEKWYKESDNISQKDIRQREPPKMSKTERSDLVEQQEYKQHDHKKKVRLEEDDEIGERKKNEMSQKGRMESEDEINKKKNDEITMKGKQILDKRKQQVFENESKESEETEDQKERFKIEEKERELLQKKSEVFAKSIGYESEDGKYYKDQPQKQRKKQLVSKDERNELEPEVQEEYIELRQRERRIQVEPHKERKESEEYEREDKNEYKNQPKIEKREHSHKKKGESGENEIDERKEYKEQPQNRKSKYEISQKERDKLIKEFEEQKQFDEISQKESAVLKKYESELRKDYKARPQTEKSADESEKEREKWEEYETEEQQEFERKPQKECRPEKCDKISQKHITVSEKYEKEEQKEYKVQLQQQVGRKQELSHKETEQLEEYGTKYRKEYKEWPQKEKLEQVLSQKETEEYETEHQKEQDYIMEKQKDFEFQKGSKLERAEAVTRKESDDVMRGESEYDESKLKTLGKRQRLDKPQKIEKEDEKEKAKPTTQDERKKIEKERITDKSEKVSPRNGQGFEKDEKIKLTEVTPKGIEKLEKEKTISTPQETQKWERDKKREEFETSPQERQKLEKDKISKMSPEERHRWEKADKGDKREKMIPKVREAFGKEEKIAGKDRKIRDKIEEDLPVQDGQPTVSKEGTQIDRKKPPYPTSIEITEKIIDSERILKVERKPVSRADSRSSGSIDVVTRSQFELLAAAVQQLRGIVTPKPLALPDNKQLMSDVLLGTATLPDAMQTLQVDARLRAAENAVVRMAGLLTQLASAGGLPDDMFDQLQALEQSYTEMQTEAGQEVGLYRPDQVDKSFTGRLMDGKKSVAIDPKSALGKAKTDGGISHDLSIIEPTPTSSMISRPSAMSRSSRASSFIAAKVPCVTYDEMKDELKALRDDILKCLNNMTERAATLAETSLHVAKGVAEKLDMALQVDDRISIVFSVVEDYAEQLKGFDSGLATQMQCFQDQMAQMRSDLHAGLVQLEKVNNNAETVAVLELTERYEELAGELESTLHAHKALTTFQEQLSAELRGLVECMEMLREQKADRDEVLDGLRDKADTSKLAGLLSEAEFAEVRADFERRIDLCHDKFNRQDEVWQTAIRDLKSQVDKKAELVELLAMRDDTQKHLQHINDQIRVLAAALGEPKAALVTRKLAEDTTCGACRERALMEPYERAHGAPRVLPALRPPPVGAAEEPCLADWAGAPHVEDRHICHRWAGGSHTLVSEGTRRVVAPPVQYDLPTRKYMDYGDDGRLYKMETECQPCVECNLERAELMIEEACLQGAGDTAPEPGPEPQCSCPET